jgi:hypothetical protein
MKKLLLLLLIPLMAGKNTSVNPEYLGKYKYYDPDKKQLTVWILNQNPKDAGKIDFRRPTDTKPLFTVEMTDATHFKTKHEFTDHINENLEIKRTCTGSFSGGEMTLLLEYESVSYGLSKNLTHHSAGEHVYEKMRANEPMLNASDTAAAPDK